MTAKTLGHAELRAALGQSAGLICFVGIFSACVNLLMLTGPLYMLQLYDRVLGSHSVETLVALSLLVVFLYAMMGLLDYARGRVMGRIGARFQDQLDRRVFDAVLRKKAVGRDNLPGSGLRDLEQVQRSLTAPGFTALFDMPWTPIFLAGIWIFHPWLGVLAVIGGLVLVALTWLNQIVSRRLAITAASMSYQADTLANRTEAEAGMVGALGLRDALFERWHALRRRALRDQIGAVDVSGVFYSMTKILRLLLQSAMLGLGAFLVLREELTPGGMIAGSILLGRALAPIELIIGQWAMMQSALKAWDGLGVLLGEIPPEPRRTALPHPAARMSLNAVSIVPPGAYQPSLRSVSFAIEPGQAIGVIGPSGAGKSTLARAITGSWPALEGEVRLDGTILDHYSDTDLGAYIGYLPQRVPLFDGTVAENIACLTRAPDADKVLAAAKMADAHDMIVRLPAGYDTPLSGSGDQLSGGQIQRIGLARAMYGNPVILVLDEPNSNLDNDGSEAVNAAIRSFKSAGNAVIVIAHRPAAIKECDMLLMLEAGRLRAFGPKNQVLRQVLQNVSDVEQAAGNGGVR